MRSTGHDEIGGLLSLSVVGSEVGLCYNSPRAGTLLPPWTFDMQLYSLLDKYCMRMARRSYMLDRVMLFLCGLYARGVRHALAGILTPHCPSWTPQRGLHDTHDSQ